MNGEILNCGGYFVSSDFDCCSVSEGIEIQCLIDFILLNLIIFKNSYQLDKAIDHHMDLGNVDWHYTRFNYSLN